jgi:ATP-dependent DNA helicase RecG
VIDGVTIESQTIEWKEQWKDEYLAWISGFANSSGGTLVLGKNDTGEPIGVINAKKLMTDLPNKIRDGLGIIVEIHLLCEKDKDLIEIKVPAYPVPISYKGRYYIRSGATNQRLSGHALESFILNKRGASWDNLPLPGFTLDNISDQAVKHFKKLAAKKGRIPADYLDEPKENLLERLGLIKDGYLTNAAMLLFSEDPQRWQQGAYVKIGFFRNHADLEYQDEIRGPLIDQIDRIIEVIHLKYMKARITYEGIQRIERYFVPDEALREAILNAICHKDYSRSIPIQISVYDDQLYIGNVGRLPEHWTIDDLLGKHNSIPFNPDIANVFYLAGHIESWSHGKPVTLSGGLSSYVKGISYSNFVEAADKNLYIAKREGRDRIIYR